MEEVEEEKKGSMQEKRERKEEGPEERERERKEKAQRMDRMKRLIDILLREGTMQYNEFVVYAAQHRIRSQKSGGHLVLFPHISCGMLFASNLSQEYVEPPSDEVIVCNGENKYGLICSISNKKIQYLHRAKNPFTMTFTVDTKNGVGSQ